MKILLIELNHYSNLITAAATVALAVLTAFLCFENRFLRKAGAAPEIVAYLAPNADGSGAVEFVLANIGRGPAFNVKHAFAADDADFEAHRVMLVNDENRTPISVIPQGEKLVVFFGVGFELYGNIGKDKIGPLKPFAVRIEYSDIFNRRHMSNRFIDIRQFAGLRGIISKSNMRIMADSLEGIEKHLASMAHQTRRSSAMIHTTQISDQYVQKKKVSAETPSD